MESVKHTIKEAMQVIQELDFGEDTCSIKLSIQKRMQNTDISKLMNLEKTDISWFWTIQIRKFKVANSKSKIQCRQFKKINITSIQLWHFTKFDFKLSIT